MAANSRQRAREWPYPRQQEFELALRAAAAAWLAQKNYPVHKRYPYILADWNDWPRNILVPEVVQYIQAKRQKRHNAPQGFPLHKYIHHGLSSQAMLLNLVGPLVVRNDLEPLRFALELAGVPWPKGDLKAEFEIEDRDVFREDSGQPTSLDLVLEGEGPGLYVEAKLVEKAFGGCSVYAAGDCDGQNPAHDLDRCYLHFIGRTYWQRLADFGFLKGPIGQGPLCVLSSHYQFFREVLFALAKGGHFVLLADERNPVFYRDGAHGPRGLIPFLLQMTPAEYQGHIHCLTVQHVVGAVKASGRHEHWIGEFEKKYALAA